MRRIGRPVTDAGFGTDVLASGRVQPPETLSAAYQVKMLAGRARSLTIIVTNTQE
ncbi:MAG: hypothetical protein JXJ20_12095 [Anaerolineae bacterium]|nr:hypothetical protein [Anaerolineae bacterium]